MSHIVVVKVEIKDIEAVKRLCTNLGWEFCENQKTYTWYGRWVGEYENADSALKQGVSSEQLGTCDHAIKVPGCNYELGLRLAGDQYQLLWDHFDSNLKAAMGGEGGEKFLQEYGLACVTLEAERNGYHWSKTVLDNGNYEVEIETY